MMQWVQSWERLTWVMAVGLILAVIVVLVLLFGADTISSWISALWNRNRGA